MKEMWRIVKDCSVYKVSNRGRVCNTRNDRLLKPLINSQGYLMVMLCNRSFRKRCYIHRLVLIAFRGYPFSSEETRHLDDVKTNNWLSNLRWGTKEENWEDRRLYGNNLQGEGNGKSKLRTLDVLVIRKGYRKRVNVKVLSKKFKVSVAQIHRIVNYKSWKHVA